MAWNYETLTNTLIPNTIMEKGFLDGVHKIYRITPIDGYVLHDGGRDYALFDDIGDPILDENGEQIVLRGYSRTMGTCGANYDFSTSQITLDDGSVVTAYGLREFFAIPEANVPSDQIFTVPGSEPEVM